MSIKQMLEQLELYGAKVMDQADSTFSCQCRFSHTFTYEKLEDWCKMCQTPDFQESLISEINAELEELDNNIQVFKVTQYGVVTVICPIGHITDYDVDDIPNECTKCNTRTIGSENAIWHDYTKNINVTHMDDSDMEYSSDFIEDDDYVMDSLNLRDCNKTGLSYESDDDNNDEDTDVEYETDPTATTDEDANEGDSCCDDWFTKWDNLSDDDTGETLMHVHHRVTGRPNQLVGQGNIYNLFKEFGEFSIDLDNKLDNTIYAKKIRTSEFRVNNIDLNINDLFNLTCDEPNNDTHTEPHVSTSDDELVIEAPEA